MRGIIAALVTIFPERDLAGDYDIFGMGRSPLLPQPISRNQLSSPSPRTFDAVPPGSFSSAAIVLLTDGRETGGVSIGKAARMAADRGVRVYTVGVGTPGLTQLTINGQRMEVGFDEDALKAIARDTRGAYFHASTAKELNTVYRTLEGKVVLEKKAREVTALLTALGAILMLGSGALSLAWSNRFA